MGSAYQFHSWRVFVLVCAFPSVFAIGALTTQPESPRFFLEVPGAGAGPREGGSRWVWFVGPSRDPYSWGLPLASRLVNSSRGALCAEKPGRLLTHGGFRFCRQGPWPPLLSSGEVPTLYFFPCQVDLGPAGLGGCSPSDDLLALGMSSLVFGVLFPSCQGAPRTCSCICLLDAPCYRPSPVTRCRIPTWGPFRVGDVGAHGQR